MSSSPSSLAGRGPPIASSSFNQTVIGPTPSRDVGGSGVGASGQMMAGSYVRPNAETRCSRLGRIFVLGCTLISAVFSVILFYLGAETSSLDVIVVTALVLLLIQTITGIFIAFTKRKIWICFFATFCLLNGLAIGTVFALRAANRPSETTTTVATSPTTPLTPTTPLQPTTTTTKPPPANLTTTTATATTAGTPSDGTSTIKYRFLATDIAPDEVISPADEQQVRGARQGELLLIRRDRARLDNSGDDYVLTSPETKADQRSARRRLRRQAASTTTITTNVTTVRPSPTSKLTTIVANTTTTESGLATTTTEPTITTITLEELEAASRNRKVTLLYIMLWLSAALDLILAILACGLLCSIGQDPGRQIFAESAIASTPSMAISAIGTGSRAPSSSRSNRKAPPSALPSQVASSQARSQARSQMPLPVPTSSIFQTAPSSGVSSRSRPAASRQAVSRLQADLSRIGRLASAVGSGAGGGGSSLSANRSRSLSSSSGKKDKKKPGRGRTSTLSRSASSATKLSPKRTQSSGTPSLSAFNTSKAK